MRAATWRACACLRERLLPLRVNESWCRKHQQAPNGDLNNGTSLPAIVGFLFLQRCLDPYAVIAMVECPATVAAKHKQRWHRTANDWPATELLAYTNCWCRRAQQSQQQTASWTQIDHRRLRGIGHTGIGQSNIHSTEQTSRMKSRVSQQTSGDVWSVLSIKVWADRHAFKNTTSARRFRAYDAACAREKGRQARLPPLAPAMASDAEIMAATSTAAGHLND